MRKQQIGSNWNDISIYWLSLSKYSFNIWNHVKMLYQGIWYSIDEATCSCKNFDQPLH